MRKKRTSLFIIFVFLFFIFLWGRISSFTSLKAYSTINNLNNNSTNLLSNSNSTSSSGIESLLQNSSDINDNSDITNEPTDINISSDITIESSNIANSNNISSSKESVSSNNSINNNSSTVVASSNNQTNSNSNKEIPAESSKSDISSNIIDNSSLDISEVPSSSAPIEADKYIVGYYTSWSRYNGFYPENVNVSCLTHINYAFAKLGSDFKISMSDSTVDLKNFEALNAIKKTNTHLKTLISVGGWTYSTYFSNAALTASSREVFAQSCLDFILQYGFDGIDIDWEYPVSGGMPGNITRAEDKQNFTLLLKAIREKLDLQSEKDGKTYYLTIATPPSAWYLKNIEVTEIAKIVDYLFIMGYDFHGPWDSYSDFNAPLYTVTGVSQSFQSSVQDGINAYINAGISASKLVLGMPFYGYQYTVSDTSNNGLYSKFSSAKSISYDNVLINYLNNPIYTLFYHNTARIPYLFINNTFISFENEQSITEKTQFAKSMGLKGVGAWELSYDKNSTLLKYAYSTLYN